MIVASTGSVAIRRFEIGDATLLYEAVRESLPHLCSALTWCREDYSPAQALMFLRYDAVSWQDGTRYDFAIFNTSHGELLGSIGFSKMDRQHKLANIGYWVRTSRFNQGVGRQAIMLAARYAFERLGINRIEFVIPIGNLPSLHVAKAAGARQESILRQRILLKGTFHDAVLLSLLRSDLVSMADNSLART